MAHRAYMARAAHAARRGHKGGHGAKLFFGGARKCGEGGESAIQSTVGTVQSEAAAARTGGSGRAPCSGPASTGENGPEAEFRDQSKTEPPRRPKGRGEGVWAEKRPR
eukprot:8309290-Pyramimonas_sp.AAC.1